ncbi:MAG: hypothetical protein WCK27_13745 [Verrucomicrobiota bacterium]
MDELHSVYVSADILASMDRLGTSATVNWPPHGAGQLERLNWDLDKTAQFLLASLP